MQPNNLVGHTGSLHSWPGPARWPLPLPWANRPLPSRGERAIVRHGTAVFSLWLLFLGTSASSNFCFILSPFPLFVINDIHLAPCSLPRTFCDISHLVLGPILAGEGSVRQSPEMETWEQRSLKGVQLLGPQAWALPSAQPSLSSASPLVLGPGPFGAS